MADPDLRKNWPIFVGAYGVLIVSLLSHGQWLHAVNLTGLAAALAFSTLLPGSRSSRFVLLGAFTAVAAEELLVDLHRHASSWSIGLDVAMVAAFALFFASTLLRRRREA